MKLIKVAAGVLNQTPLDWERNLQNIISAVQQARKQRVAILCLPEMCITGYGCEDTFYSPGVQATALDMLQRVVPLTEGITTCVGLPIMYAGGIFNAVCLLSNQQIIGLVAKQHLAGDGIHYEQRWFKAWPEGVQGGLRIGDRKYPLGDLLFQIGGIRIGFEICEDAWVGSRPGASHAARGADFILNPSASHFAFGKHEVRRRFVIEGSRAFNVSYIYANLVGNESGRAIFDGDAMIASSGELMATGPRLSFQQMMLTTSTVDIEKTRMIRARTSSFEPDLDGDETDVIRAEFDYGETGIERCSLDEPAWTRSEDIKCEEFTRCVALGLLDYMLKSRSFGFVVSLSGGVDSASAAVLVSTAFRLAALELGFDGLLQRLQPISHRFGRKPENINDLVQELLTTVYQRAKNSSDVTRDAARDVAQAIGAMHLELDVEPMVQAYTQAVEKAMQLDLNWTDHDISLQNIQSRARAPGVWMIANLKNALLVSTSNRSEAAVGYATMDGDTSGGLSPLAGIDKAFLERWLRWMESIGPATLSPLPPFTRSTSSSPRRN